MLIIGKERCGFEVARLRGFEDLSKASKLSSKHEARAGEKDDDFVTLSEVKNYCRQHRRL